MHRPPSEHLASPRAYDQAPAGALDSLRTVVFRQTLRGYHIDDVDRYLEQVAVEVDALRGRHGQAGTALPAVPRRSAQRPAVRTRAGDGLTWAPAKGWAVVTCMDARVDVRSLFGGVGPGDAHVIRNAGGVVTDDVIRSLSISQRVGRTHTVLLVHHTDCSLLAITDEEFARDVTRESGCRPSWTAQSFSDLDDDVRRSIDQVEASPFIPRKDSIRGYVYDLATGNLRQVEGKAQLARTARSGSGAPMWGGWW